MKLQTYNHYFGNWETNIDEINTEYNLWKELNREYVDEITRIKYHNKLLKDNLDKLIRKNSKKECDYWYILSEKNTKNIKIGITNNFDRRLKEHLDSRSKEEIFKDHNHWEPIFVGEISTNYSTSAFEMLMKLALIYENRDNEDFQNMGPTKKEWFVNNECPHEKLISYFKNHNFSHCKLEEDCESNIEEVPYHILQSFDNVLNKLNIFISDYSKVTRGDSIKYRRKHPDRYNAILQIDELINSDISRAYRKLNTSV